MRGLRALLLPALLMAAAAPVLAAGAGPRHDHAGQGEGAAAGTGDAMAADVELRAAALVDRHGRPIRFPEEAIGDRIVLISFAYTTCTTACPISTAIMAQVQAELDGVAGAAEIVRPMTITVDPVTDTPERLAEYADRFGADSGWLWLTGDYPAIVDVLTGLDVYTPDFRDHPPVILIGDGRSGEWRRFYGFPPPERLVGRVKTLLAARRE